MTQHTPGPMSNDIFGLRIIHLTNQRDTLLAVLRKMLPLMEWSTAAEREPIVKVAREIMADVQGPPDPADWTEESAS